MLTNTLKSGGAEKQSVLLAKALSNHYDTTLIVLDSFKSCDKKLLSLVDLYKIKIVYLDHNGLKRILNFIRLVYTNNPTVMFSYLAYTNTLNAIVGKVLSVKYRIGGIRNSFSPFSKLILQRVLHNYLLTFSIANSYTGSKYHIASGFHEKSIRVIHNCYDLTEKYYLRPKNNIIQILAVGRFVKQKDYTTLLESYQLLLKKLAKINISPNTELVIIGYGEAEDEIRQFIQKLSISNNVSIILNPENLFHHFKQADIFVSTSIFEGLSNSILEAMANSLPVVATNVGDNSYMILEGENGFLCKIKDKDCIAECLLKLCLDYELRIMMGKKSYDLVKYNFSIQQFQLKYINMITDECKI